MNENEIKLQAARRAYINMVLHTELDRDECIAKLTEQFGSEIAEFTVSDVESELEELN